LSPIEREQINAQVDEWICEGIVQPSLLEYASPVVLAWKKDGLIRLCVDYRQLNKKIIKDPLPRGRSARSAAEREIFQYA
jgi:hypothetical protein